MSLVLLRKEAREHALALAFVTLAGLATNWILLFAMMAVDSPSLLSASSSAHRTTIPFAALFVTFRLFAREQELGTREFLASLPLSAGRIFWTKFAFAALWLGVLSAGTTTAIALVAQHRELVAVEWFVQLIVRGWLVSLVWLGLFASMAQLGRYGSAALAAGVLVLLLPLGAPDHPATFWVDWLAAMPHDIETTRRILGLPTLFVAALWALVSTAAAARIAAKDGGTWAAALHRPLAPGEHAALYAGLATLLALSNVAAADAETSRSPDLPSIGAGPIRTAAPRGSSTHAVGRRLDDLVLNGDAELGPIAWKPFSLIGLSVERAPGLEDASNFVVLDPSWTPDAALAAAAQAQWQAQGARWLLTVDDWSTLARGLPTVWLARATDDAAFEATAGRRAAWAAREGVPAELVRAWPELRMRFGVEVADGVAHVVARAVVEACGERALARLAGVVLRPRSGSGWSRWWSAPPELSTVCPPAAALDQLGMNALAEAAVEHAAALAAVPGAPAPPERRPSGAYGVQVSAPRPLPRGATLRWAVVDPLAPAWQHGPLKSITLAEGDVVSLPVEPSRRIVAAIEVWTPALSARRTSGLRELK